MMLSLKLKRKSSYRIYDIKLPLIAVAFYFMVVIYPKKSGFVDKKKRL